MVAIYWTIDKYEWQESHVRGSSIYLQIVPSPHEKQKRIPQLFIFYFYIKKIIPLLNTRGGLGSLVKHSYVQTQKLKFTLKM